MGHGKSYLNRDINALQRSGAPSQLLIAWKHHWTGQLASSAEVSRSWLGEQQTATHEWYALAAADLALVEAKIGHERTAFLDRIPRLRGAARFAAAYSVFTREWGRDQRRVWPALRSMLATAFVMCSIDALLMSIFLMGHTAAIAGWRRLGCFVASCAFRGAVRERAAARGSWQQGPPRRQRSPADLASFYGMVMASIPCTLWLRNSNDRAFTKLVHNASRLLPEDPYYKAIFNHCSLYRAAYTGRILDAEIFAERLIKENASGKLQRYIVPAQLLAMVPMAIRGYSHLLGAQVEDLLSQLQSTDDGAAKAASYRAAAIISLCQGRRARSLEYIQLAHGYDSSSGFRAVWEDIDGRIKKYAASDDLFCPTRDLVVAGLEQSHFAPNSGQFLSRIVQVTEDTFGEGERSYGKHVAAALADHFSVHASCADKSQEVDNEAIPIQFPHFSILLDQIPPERRNSLHTQISTLSPLLKNLAHMRTYRVAAESSSNDRAVAATAYQVAHDIRSPLAALHVVAQNISEVPEDVRVLLKSSVDRIKEIADVLIEQSRTKAHAPELTPEETLPLCMPVATLVDEIVAEKKATLEANHGKVIEHLTAVSGQALFVDHCVSELRRSLSNLLTNALEAIAANGRVTIEVSESEGNIAVVIGDNGCGIPESIIPQLFARKSTFGKVHGNGLGLYFAKQTAEQLGGCISLKSRLGEGTTITMKFPKSKEPSWFQKSISLPLGTCVATIDDDYPIHHLWNVRLKRLHKQEAVRIETFRNPETFTQWWTSLSHEERRAVFVLCDHEMQINSPSGLDLIQKLNLEKQAVLVTSHCGDVKLQQACVARQIRMIPKSMAFSIPLYLTSSTSRRTAPGAAAAPLSPSP